MAQLVTGLEDHPEFNSAAKYKQQRGQRERNKHDEDQKQRAKTSLPEAPFAPRKPVSAAKALHQRKHQSQPRENAERNAREDQARRMRVTRLDCREHQANGVSGKNLPGDPANFTHDCRAFRRLRDKRGEHDECGKEHQHAGIRGSFGGVEHVVLESQEYCLPEMSKKSRHSIHLKE